MTHAAPVTVKIPTVSPQPRRGRAVRPAGRPAAGRVRVTGSSRTATRGGGDVIELESGITVYAGRLAEVIAEQEARTR